MAQASKKNDCIALDGRTLEGGGQLIRNALCLSALTDRPIKITDIRGNRSGGGGLKAQHLACVKWLAHACNATVDGAEKGSRTLLFEPSRVEGGLSPAFKKRKVGNGIDAYECRLDIGSAGSTGLALQAILPYLLFTTFPSPIPVHLTVSGGTNVSGSPSYEYIQHVLLPTLHRIGFPAIKATLHKRGWSHGGSSIGSFTLEIPPRRHPQLSAFSYGPPLDVTSARPTTAPSPSSLHAIFVAPSSCHDHFRTVLAPAVTHHFGLNFTAANGSLQITCEGSLHEKRLYMILIATIPAHRGSYVLARDWLYDRKIRTHERAATEMAERVCNELAGEWESGAWVDEHMRDQLVIFQALANGASEVYPGRDPEREDRLREPSLHARTAEWVAKQMLQVKFDAEGKCEGCGFGGTDRNDAFVGPSTEEFSRMKIG